VNKNNKKFQEETLPSLNIFKGRIINLREDKVSLPNGKITTREIIEHPGAVVVLAINKKKEIIMIKQFRKAAEEVIWELPAGTLEKNEKLIDCARRELEEETGYYSQKITKIITYFSTPGFSDEKLTFFIAEDLEKRNKNEDEDEFIQVENVKISDALKMIKENVIKDAKTIIGILYFISCISDKKMSKPLK